MQALSDWTDELEVMCADIGSIPQGNFAWARRYIGDAEVPHDPLSIAALAGAVAHELQQGRPVALGLEAPLFLPVPDDPTDLGKARPCDAGGPAWSSNVGASVMATGIAQSAWLLARVREACPDAVLHLSWESFAEAPGGLLVWEAFVTGEAKGASHEEDASIGVQAFCAQLPTPGDAVAAGVHRPLSLVAATALWGGWPVQAADFHAPCVLVRA